MKGNYIIDDREANGILDFEGEHIKFGEGEYIGWDQVLNYLLSKEESQYRINCCDLFCGI